MSEAAPSSVSRLARVITAIERGELPEQDVAEFLLNGFRRAIFEKCTIEDGLGLSGKWRGHLLLAEQLAAVAAIPQPKAVSVRAAARALREKLIVYRSRSFNLDKGRKPAARTDAALFRLLESRGGRVPGMTVLREIVGQPTTLFSGHNIPDDGSQKR